MMHIGLFLTLSILFACRGDWWTSGAMFGFAIFFCGEPIERWFQARDEKAKRARWAKESAAHDERLSGRMLDYERERPESSWEKDIWK